MNRTKKLWRKIVASAAAFTATLLTSAPVYASFESSLVAIKTKVTGIVLSSPPMFQMFCS